MGGRGGAVAGVCALVVLGAHAPAADASFTVFPSVLELRRPPGGTLVGVFHVRLGHETGTRFRTTVKDVAQEPGGAFVFRPRSGSRYSASNWVVVSPRAFRGAPERVQPVEFHIRVPRDAGPRDYLT